MVHPWYILDTRTIFETKLDEFINSVSQFRELETKERYEST